jgi:ArsR family transcriptional regulator, arsenate/arsenite/antimonite-responsive transcriptional repressor
VNTSTTVKLAGLTGAGLLSVAADPVRWRLMSALAGGPRCVCELQPAAGVSAPALSHHLKVLREAGLVAAARRGRWIDYTLAPDAAARLRAALPVGAADSPLAGCCAEPAAAAAADTAGEQAVQR